MAPFSNETGSSVCFELERWSALGRKRKSMVSSPGQAKKANWGARPAVPDTAKGLFSTILFKTRASLPHRLLLFSTFPVTNVA